MYNGGRSARPGVRLGTPRLAHHLTSLIAAYGNWLVASIIALECVGLLLLFQACGADDLLIRQRLSGCPRQTRPSVARRGLMLVLSSPSGAGKTTLSRMLLKADRQVELSISVTTRPQRRGETDGRDYYFIDLARFEAMTVVSPLFR